MDRVFNALGALGSIIAAIAASAAAFFAFQSLADSHLQTETAQEQVHFAQEQTRLAELQTQIAQVQAEQAESAVLKRSCASWPSIDVRNEDEMLIFNGATGAAAYQPPSASADIRHALSSSLDRALRCDFTNDGRVALHDVQFSFTVTFHEIGKKQTWAIAPALMSPAEERRVWVLNSDMRQIGFELPDIAEYRRFVSTPARDSPLSPVRSPPLGLFGRR